MLTTLHRWAIEVDQDQWHCNLTAQRNFSRDVGEEVYQAVERRLPALRHVYFTRIYWPSRDRMGAYVRLHFFVREPGGAVAVAELDRMLREYKARNPIFQIRKQVVDGIAEAKVYGAASFPEVYYACMEALNRAAVQLFRAGVSDHDLWETIARNWSHNFFNVMLGDDPMKPYWPQLLAQRSGTQSGT